MKKNRVLKAFSLLSFLFLLAGCNDNSNDQNDGWTGELAKGPNLHGEEGVAIRYQRKDNNYEDYGLRIWENNGGEGKLYPFTVTDDFGGACFLPLSTFSSSVKTNGLGIITRRMDSWTGQSADMILDFSLFDKDEDGYYNVFSKENDNKLYATPDFKFADEILTASFETSSQITVETSNPISSYELYENGTIIDSKDNLDVTSFNYHFTVNHLPDIKNDYKVSVTFKESGVVLESAISIRGLYNTDMFNDEYYFDGELGAIYNSGSTTFRVWSPLSESIKLRLYENGTPTSVNDSIGSDKYKEYNMSLKDKGVFEITIQGDLEGLYYTYVVTNETFKNKEIVDPYAKSTGANGLRGMIVDFSKTNPDGWNEAVMNDYERTSLVIYETHVADVTSNETWNGTNENRKKFLGMYESGTTYEENNITVKTGFDHIKELGINAIQLLPIFDQANDELATGDDAFNWGYNPLNYNSLDGIYSTNPYDGYTKIKEFKELVKAYNEAGINVIMDVVYNHVNASNGSNFDVLMPGYFFRYNDDGTLSNGSGCGNETASENAMMRKFMVDSTEFWAKEYHLGGFRFDLMGLHDIETMNEITSNLKENVNENIFVHGEPWTGGTTTLGASSQAVQNNINKFKGFGAFNDKIRDNLIKGGLSAVSEKGWATSGGDSINSGDYVGLTSSIKGNTGTLSRDPLKSTNYVTCHDNYTLYDRIKETGFKGSDEEIARMATLANAVVFTSQGTSFLLAGEEMLRTKGGDGNSYESGYEINSLDYSRLIKFNKLYQNYKFLINFKKEFKGLHYQKEEEINSNLTINNDSLSYRKLDYEINFDGEVYRVIHLSSANLTDYTIDLSDYEIIFDSIDNFSTLNIKEYPLASCKTIISKKL